MLGNRTRQRAFQIPILVEIAILSGELDARRYNRRKSEGVSDLVREVLSYFSFSAAERKERHAKSDQLVLENDVRWSADQLEELGELSRIKDEKWGIAESGQLRLRKYVVSLLRKEIDGEEIDKLMMVRNYNEEEWLLQALKIIAEASVRLPNYSLETLLKTGSSLRNVFLNAVSNIPPDEIGNFVLYGYELIKPYIIGDLAQRHRLIAA